MTAEEIARYVVAKAVWAPSVHNTQPWRFTADGQQISLHADADRRLVVTQVAVSVRREPDDVLFSAGGEYVSPGRG